MKKYYKISILFLLIIFAFRVSAQEVITKLNCNPVLKKYNKDHSHSISKKKQILQDTLTLPFYDDFSKPAIYPDPTLWKDNYTFVNTGYNAYSGNSLLDTVRSHNPPNIGILTLDAIDAEGNIYVMLQPDNPAVADTLTSKPINLNFPPSDSVYLSFQYQPTGIGNTPESNDSLILEFFSPTDTSWHSVWYALGSTDKTYKKVMLPITDTIFLKSGFQFRFKNYVTLGSNYEPSWLSNCDQWNLDFILLDTNRHYNDTIVEEIGMLYPVKSVLKYSMEAMPWQHYKAAGTSLNNSSEILMFRNIGTTITWAVNRKIQITDLAGFAAPFVTSDDFENATPDKIHFLNRYFTYPFSTNTTDSAEFEIKCYLDLGQSVTVLPRYLGNDTTYYRQKFYNYYAYDDGTAEAGYGLSGEGAMNSKMAVKFKCYKRDTLRGVDIFFNNTMDNYTGSKFFYLNVWNDASGLPGDTIRCQMGEQPHFDGLNEYHTYKFTTPLVIDSGATFYVGVMQTTNDMLNIGYDRNRDVHENLYYSISGTWVQSSYSGALMMRPLFGKQLPDIVSVANIELPADQFDLYPNPASGILNINYAYPTDLEKSTITITDICGRTAIQTSFASSIDVSNLSPGIYFITITDPGKNAQTKKFIISR